MCSDTKDNMPTCSRSQLLPTGAAQSLSTAEKKNNTTTNCNYSHGTLVSASPCSTLSAQCQRLAPMVSFILKPITTVFRRRRLAGCLFLRPGRASFAQRVLTAICQHNLSGLVYCICMPATNRLSVLYYTGAPHASAP